MRGSPALNSPPLRPRCHYQTWLCSAGRPGAAANVVRCRGSRRPLPAGHWARAGLQLLQQPHTPGSAKGYVTSGAALQGGTSPGRELERLQQQRPYLGLRSLVILQPYLFNLYTAYLLRNPGLDEAQAGIKMAGRNINNLRYADNTTLVAESKELKSLLMKVRESEKAGLKLNIKKTKIMASGPITS